MLWLWMLACNPVENPLPCESEGQDRITLPADDAVHQEDTEWWTWSGHLSDENGSWYGFQLGFFLFGTGQTRSVRANAAVTDIDGQAFHHDSGQDSQEPTLTDNGFDFALGSVTALGGDGLDSLSLEAGPTTLDLDLESLKPPVFHHGDGYLEPSAGGYAYHYSRTRMSTTGTLRTSNGSQTVSGHAWFDHQWGDLQPLATSGWDWFALTLEDGREFMLFTVHDGEDTESSGGTWVDPGCGVLEISPEAVHIRSLGTWTSPRSGCTYPMGWSIQVLDEIYTLTPVLEDQELVTEDDQASWKGAATVVGPITGRAIIELTGYCN